jgi:hypothetical protein
MTTMSLPRKKEVTPTLLARRLGMGRGDFGLAEWPGKIASGSRRKAGAAGAFLSRLGEFAWHGYQDVPDWRLDICRCDERQTISDIEPQSNPDRFAVVADDVVRTRMNRSLAGFVSMHRGHDSALLSY